MISKKQAMARLTLDEQRAINLLQATNWSMPYIANETDLALERVHYLRRLYQVGFNHTAPAEGRLDKQAVVDEAKKQMTRADVTPEWLRKVRLEEGWSLEMMAEAVGLSRERIRQLLKKQGITGPVRLRHRTRPAKTTSCNETYFDNIDTEHKAYWLGYLSAKANFNQGVEGYYSLVLSSTVAKGRAEHASLLLDVLEIPHDERLERLSKVENYDDQYFFTVHSHKICLRLMELGVNPHNRGDVSFPTFLEPKLLPHFLRGFYDVKGFLHEHLPKESQHFSLLFMANKNFLCSLGKYLEQEAGFQHRETGKYIINKEFSRENYRYCNSRVSNIKKFYDLLYSDETISLPYKKQQYIPFLAHYASLPSSSTTY